MTEFNFYFAGHQGGESQKYMIQRGCNILKSWLCERNFLDQLITAKKEGKYTGKIMVDSGAFTAHRRDTIINCDEYIDWLNKNNSYLECYVQLDQIPGKWGQKRSKQDILSAERASWENYVYMVSKLKDPFKLLAVFHMDENFDNLKRLLDFKIDGNKVPYICISGAKDRTASERCEWYHKCFQIIRESDNKDVKVHCLGCSTFGDLSLFPFYSSDSTSWALISGLGKILDKDVISVSQNLLKNAEIAARLNYLVPQIKLNCARFGVDFEQLKTSYVARAVYNIQFMLDWIENNVKNRKEIKIRTRRLF